MGVCRVYDRAGMTTATAGTGTITLGSAISNAYFSFSNAGVQDGERVRYVIDDGTDFEIGEGNYTASGTTLTRAIVIRSNIAGVQGTTKLTLSGTATVRIDVSRADMLGATLFGQQYAGMVNGIITASVAANALTINIKTLAGADPSVNDPVIFISRNSTLATGDYSVARVTAATSIVISSSATLGHASARDQQIIIYALDNGGAIELAVATKLFDQSARLVSTTAMSAAATSAAVMYSTSLRSNLAWYPIARCISNQTTAGTWTAVPTQIDLAPFTLPINSCKIYLNAAQTLVASATHTKINFDTVALDADSIAVLGSNRIQPKVPGTYRVTTAFDATPVGGSISGLMVISIAQNGTRVSQGLSFLPTNTEAGLNTTDDFAMNGTSDFLEAQAYITLTAGTATLSASSVLTRLSCARVGP